MASTFLCLDHIIYYLAYVVNEHVYMGKGPSVCMTKQVRDWTREKKENKNKKYIYLGEEEKSLSRLKYKP